LSPSSSLTWPGPGGPGVAATAPETCRPARAAFQLLHDTGSGEPVP
jgi:hypothetical protein